MHKWDCCNHFSSFYEISYFPLLPQIVYIDSYSVQINCILIFSINKDHSFYLERERVPKFFIRVKKIWKPSDENCYKTNFYGALFEKERKVGIEVVVRNHRGEVMVSLSKKY